MFYSNIFLWRAIKQGMESCSSSYPLIPFIPPRLQVANMCVLMLYFILCLKSAVFLKDSSVLESIYP